MKHVLITGGMGFIGSHLARAHVSAGDEVTILSRSDRKLHTIKDLEGKVVICIKDVRDISEEDVKNKDYVYHLAGTVDNYSINEDPYYDIDINCKGTIALLEAIKVGNPKAKVFFASTFFVNGNVEQLPANEKSPCNPLGLYGATRLAGEHFCKIYEKLFGIDVRIARFTNVFGPYEQGNNKKKAGFNYMINLAVEGRELEVYNGGNFIRDYIYVDDVVKGCQTIMVKGETGKIYYIGRGEPIKFKELIDLIVHLLPGTKTKIIVPPAFHTKVGIGDFFADTTALSKLGWKPEVSLEEGISRTIKYYQTHRQ